jgi:hypothetical protein
MSWLDALEPDNPEVARSNETLRFDT